MNVKHTYPPIKQGSKNRRRMLSVVRWPFLLAAAASLIVNLAVAGPLWGIIAVLVLYIVWTMILSPDLVEYNRVSQSIKIVAWVSILLALIDVLIVHSFSLFVIPIVCFSGLVVSIVLFFTDLRKQKHNMLPLILFEVISMIGSGIVLCLWKSPYNWPYIVLLSLSSVCFLAMIVVLGRDFKIELERRFHIQ
ncbi:MAG: hypothetical protein J6V22_04380 [Clostridia bacterium]|nr:hypothetical protein [Clostridia bacterium]